MVRHKRYFNNSEFLLIEHLEETEQGITKIHEEYLTREEAQKDAKRMMWEANTKLKKNDAKTVQDASPTMTTDDPT